MAFFGLTALGPQNTFAAKEKHFRNLQIFDESDFEMVWNRVNGVGTLHCRFSKIDEMMKILFHGPIPQNDKPHVEVAFDEAKLFAGETDTLSFTNFIKIMNKLSKQAADEEKALEGKCKPTVQFTSTSEMRECLVKCGHMKMTLQEKQTAPLTATQEYGWEKPAKLIPPAKGRGGSDITKFQAELIKNGVYY